MLVTLFLLPALSLILSLLLTPLVRTLAKRNNWLDQPDNQRKVHKNPIPRLGGIAVAAAYFGSLFAVAALFYGGAPHLGPEFSGVLTIAPAALVIFFVGLADDLLDLKPWHKFAVQIVAACMVVSTGLQLHGMAILAAHPIVAGIVTVLWLVACTNAVNLIDGLDGLAGGISLLATLTILIASLISGNVGLAVATLPLAGALFGFLVFNFNPASIFLGDGGSLLLGFLLGCFSLLWSGMFVTVLDLTAPLMVLAVPLSDTALAIARRFLRGEPIFKADRSHVHHRLLSRGLSHRSAVLFLYAAAAAAGALALGLVCTGYPWQSAVFGAFVAMAVFGIRQLHYSEFEALRRVILRGGLRREINIQLVVQTLEQELEHAATADDVWTVVQNGSAAFGFEAIRMQLASQMFLCPGHGASNQSWALRIPVSENEWVELSNENRLHEFSTALVPFANTLRRSLANKSIAAGNPAASAVYSSVMYRQQQSPAA